MLEFHKAKEVTERVLRMLVERDYDSLYRNDVDKILTPYNVEDGLKEYKLNLTMPPEHAYNNLYIYETEDDQMWCVDFDLWSHSEQTDYKLKLAVYDRGEYCDYSVLDIRML